MTREEKIDWLCRLRADLNNGLICTPWNKEFTEVLNDFIEQESYKVTECDKDHIWYKGRQYISLRRFLEVKKEQDLKNTRFLTINKDAKCSKYKLLLNSLYGKLATASLSYDFASFYDVEHKGFKRGDIDTIYCDTDSIYRALHRKEYKNVWGKRMKKIINIICSIIEAFLIVIATISTGILLMLISHHNPSHKAILFCLGLIPSIINIALLAINFYDYGRKNNDDSKTKE